MLWFGAPKSWESTEEEDEDDSVEVELAMLAQNRVPRETTASFHLLALQQYPSATLEWSACFSLVDDIGTFPSLANPQLLRGA